VVKFRGQFDLRVDDKCRLSVPAGYRQALELHGDQRLVLVKSTAGPCLQGFTVQDWEEQEDRIMALPKSDPVVLKLLRFQVASAQMVEPDGHGRFVLPPSLRPYAGIAPSSEVALVGQIRRFEIWARERWQTESEQCAESLPEWSAELARLGL